MLSNFRKNKKANSFRSIYSVLLGILALLFIGLLIVTNLKINQRRAKLASRIEALKAEIEILEKRNSELKAKISQIGKDEYLEQVARDQLGFKKTGEEVIVLKKEKEELEKIQKEEKGFWSAQNWWQWLKSKF